MIRMVQSLIPLLTIVCKESSCIPLLDTSCQRFTQTARCHRQGLPQALHSQMIWYRNDSSLLISVSSDAQSGNWLAINATRPYQLIMTLYDTALGSSVGFENPQMPELKRIGCKGAVR